MPTQGAATAYPWYGYAALVKNANTAKPQILQTRFTSKPMHYGAICNSGTTCATNPTADRQMADFFGFGVAQNGGAADRLRRHDERASTAPGCS